MDGRALWLPIRALATYMLWPSLGIVLSNSNSNRRRRKLGVYLGCSVGVGEPSRYDGVLSALDLLSSAWILGSLFHFAGDLSLDCADDARYDSWHDLVIPTHPAMLFCLVCTLSMTPSPLLFPCPAIHTLDILIPFFRRPFPQSQTHLHGIRPTHPRTHSLHHNSPPVPCCSRTIALPVTYCLALTTPPIIQSFMSSFRVLPRQSRCQSLLSILSLTILYAHTACIMPSLLARTTNRLDGLYPCSLSHLALPIDHAIAVSLTLLLSRNSFCSLC